VMRIVPPLHPPARQPLRASAAGGGCAPAT